MGQRVIRKYVVWCLGLFFICNLGYASITVSPKFLFMDASRKSIPLYVTNPGPDDAEVWLEVKFGVEKTDGNGKTIISFDTIQDIEHSAASWVRMYPRRFILAPGEMQTVRLVTMPPVVTQDGEYLARIFVTSKYRNIPLPSRQGKSSVKPGINVLTQTDLPFHYRIGKVTTGVVVNSMDVTQNDTSIALTTKLTRSGNASFWGKRTIRIINSSGKTVFTISKNTGVYTEMTIVDRVSITNLFSGTYSIEMEFATGQRQDVKSTEILQAPRVLTSATLTIP